MWPPRGCAHDPLRAERFPRREGRGKLPGLRLHLARRCISDLAPSVSIIQLRVKRVTHIRLHCSFSRSEVYRCNRY